MGEAAIFFRRRLASSDAARSWRTNHRLYQNGRPSSPASPALALCQDAFPPAGLAMLLPEMCRLLRSTGSRGTIYAVVLTRERLLRGGIRLDEHLNQRNYSELQPR